VKGHAWDTKTAAHKPKETTKSKLKGPLKNKGKGMRKGKIKTPIKTPVKAKVINAKIKIPKSNNRKIAKKKARSL
jgi:hypothetical protein